MRATAAVRVVLEGAPGSQTTRPGRVQAVPKTNTPRVRAAVVPHKLPEWVQLWFPEWWLGPRTEVERRPRCPRGPTPERPMSRQLKLRWPRKCSVLPRARTITTRRLTRIERAGAAALATDPTWDADRPVTRADCVGGPRPCLWVSCRHNLYLDVVERRDGASVKLNFPGREPDEMPPGGSCSLDIAERAGNGEGPMLFSAIGKHMNLSIERVRQLAAIALQAARVTQMREERLVQIRRRGP